MQASQATVVQCLDSVKKLVKSALAPIKEAQVAHETRPHAQDKAMADLRQEVADALRLHNEASRSVHDTAWGADSDGPPTGDGTIHCTAQDRESSGMNLSRFSLRQGFAERWPSSRHMGDG